MKVYSTVTLALLFASLPWQLRAMPNAQTSPNASGAPLTAKQARQLEKTAVTAEDHERLAAYYQVQAEQAKKNLAAAEELEQKWGPMERASKTPDPYPHARRLVAEYSADVQKYSQLAADQQWVAEKYEIATRAMKDGVDPNTAMAMANSSPKDNGARPNMFNLGPKAR